VGHGKGSSRDSRFSDDDVRLGHINGVFGLRGDVRLYLYNPASELVDQEFDAWLVSPDGTRSEVRLWLRRGSGRRILGAIHGVQTPEAASALRGYELVIPAEELPQEADGEWYHRDLLGTPVQTAGGAQLGTLQSIVEGPGMDTWVIRRGATEVWVHVRSDDLPDVRPGELIVVADQAVLRLSDS
jgi:16S rRNA processing protein RimM